MCSNHFGLMGSAIGGLIIWSAYLPKLCCRSTMRHGILPNRSDLRDQILPKSTGSLFWKVLKPFQLTWSNVSMIHNSKWHCNLILADIILWTSRVWSAIVQISQGSNSASTSVLWKYSTHSYPQWMIKIKICQDQHKSSLRCQPQLLSYLGRGRGKIYQKQSQPVPRVPYPIGSALAQIKIFGQQRQKEWVSKHRLSEIIPVALLWCLAPQANTLGWQVSNVNIYLPTHTMEGSSPVSMLSMMQSPQLQMHMHAAHNNKSYIRMYTINPYITFK